MLKSPGPGRRRRSQGATRPAENRLDPKLVALARAIERQPWNRPGSAKTWVLEALHQHRLFRSEVRAARRGEPG